MRAAPLLAALAWAAAAPALAQDPEEFIGRLDVLGPPEEAGAYIAGVADSFHAPIPPPEGYGPYPLALARSVTSSDPEATPERGCNEYENAEEVEGKVALVRDGGPCTMSSKYLYARQAGAAGIVIHADEPVGPEDNSTLQTIIWIADTYIYFYGLYITRYRGERLRAALEAGEEVTVVLRSEPPTAAEEPAPDLALSLSVWPSPARGVAFLRVGVPRAREVRVEVLDVLGRRVALVHNGLLGPGAPPLRVDLATLPAGSYFVRATGEADTRTRPLLVTR